MTISALMAQFVYVCKYTHTHINDFIGFDFLQTRCYCMHMYIGLHWQSCYIAWLTNWLNIKLWWFNERMSCFMDAINFVIRTKGKVYLLKRPVAIGGFDWLYMIIYAQANIHAIHKRLTLVFHCSLWCHSKCYRHVDVTVPCVGKTWHEHTNVRYYSSPIIQYITNASSIIVRKARERERGTLVVAVFVSR